MIDLEIIEGVAFITLNAPATRNALSNEMAGQFVAACDEADRDPQVGAAVIRGAGGTFCSGAERGHLDEVGRDPVEENRYAALGGIYRAFTRAGQLEMPTIAAVRGAAVGAGINLMLATDLRIVAEDARLISGFLRIGLHPGGGHFGLLAGRAGAEAAAAASAPARPASSPKCPPPGCSPIRRKPLISRASSATIRRSAASIRLIPAPTAAPRTAATAGTSSWPTRVKAR